MSISHRSPAAEEVEAILARARLMRSLYVAALVGRAALRARQWLRATREQRAPVARRFYPDIC